MKFKYMTRTAVTVALLSGAGHAQDSLIAGANATDGSTEVAKEGFKTAAAPTEEANSDATDISLSGGGMIASGNSRSVAVTGAGKVRLRRKQNQYSADAAVNYAESAPDLDSDREATVENYQGRVRYDRFLSRRWALFVAQTVRRDRFQGLNLRTNFDPGVAHYFLTDPSHRLWVEAGYDMQYDVRRGEAIAAAAAADEPTVVSRTEVRHAARLFAGYDNSLNEHVKFYTGLEYLQAFQDTENWRLNWENSLTSTLTDKFSLSASFVLRYDNNPLPDVEELDTVTAMSLVYTLR